MAYKQLFQNLYVIEGSTNVGVIACKNGKTTDIYLIDSGTQDSNGKNVLEELNKIFPNEKGGFNVCAIINTHSHADHCGANAYIKERTNCEIWISKGEAGIIFNPKVQASIVCGGHPFKELQGPYYLAPSSACNKILDKNTVVHLPDGCKITFTELPGHYLDMLGVIYTGKYGQTCLFCADAVFGQAHILKYWIPFLYDVKKFKETLAKIDTLEMNWYVPSHGIPVTRINETVELNQIAVLSTEYCVLSSLQKEKLTKEELLKRVADRNEIRLGFQQYQLINCTLNAYLVYLLEENQIAYTIEENRILWFAK